MASPELPPWFGGHAILREVEHLVVDDYNKAAVGWTWKEIKKSLMQTHHQQEEELPQRFDSKLRLELDKLRRVGDLKVVPWRGVGGQQPAAFDDDDDDYDDDDDDLEDHYTLGAAYLPKWFDGEAVIQEVLELDKGNDGGSTWEEIRNSLVSTHQQPEQPLPPDFDTVLRTMLSVLHQRGHLAITRGANGQRRYNRCKSPALLEPDPIDIPGYLWFYYLGYKLEGDDSDSDAQEESDALIIDAPPWFRPQTVLQEIEGLVANDKGKRYSTALFEGWSSEEIMNSLMRSHQHEPPPPQGFDATLQATLATLCKRGYLAIKTRGDESRYTLSMTPPCFPPWFHPKAVLQAVGVLDGDESFAGGSTWANIMDYFEREQHGDPQVPWLIDLIQTTLSVLHQRGCLTEGDSGPEHYTRRHAPVPPDIPDTLLCYYLGHRIRQEEKEPEIDIEIDEYGESVYSISQAADVGLRNRRGRQHNQLNEGFTVTEEETEAETDREVRYTSSIPSRLSPLRHHQGSSSDDHQDVHTPQNTMQNVEGQGGQRETRVSGNMEDQLSIRIESNDHAEREQTSEERTETEQQRFAIEQRESEQRKREKQRKDYMIRSLCLSVVGHVVLFCLTLIPGFGEEETSKKWLKWGVMDLILPPVLLTGMIAIQTNYINIEDTPPGRQRLCKLVNLSVISLSKILYMAIKEAPGPKVTLRRVIAHVVAFLIDMLGALWLRQKKNQSSLDQDVGI